jgi:glycosyltransferase involved in cell wall biosynthesis
VNRLRVLTWHVHGSYLLALARCAHELVVPVRPGRPHPYGGRGDTFPFPDTVVEVDADDVRGLDVDVVLYQSHAAWLEDRHELLSARQREAPSVFLEHDPPRESAYDTRHPVDDERVLVVHVTHFNRLMWDSGRSPATVVEHGVDVPANVRWTGELERGLVVVNNLASRGRRLGLDVFERLRERVPLDLVGMGSEELGGLGEIPPTELAAFSARYRFLFNPIRWTSLGLAVCEALQVGLPVVGLATTELATAVENGVSGVVDTDEERLVRAMELLLADHDAAHRLSDGARRRGRERFGIERFARDWDTVLRSAASVSARAAA